MAAITWTAEAQRWLEDIFEYIALDNPRAAAQTVGGIYERVHVPATFLEIGHRYWASNRHGRILLYEPALPIWSQTMETSMSWASSMGRLISPSISFDGTYPRDGPGGS
jgi:plasmid stabilization system protein ParE